MDCCLGRKIELRRLLRAVLALMLLAALVVPVASPFAAPAAATTTVQRYGVYEERFSYPSARFINPWHDVVLRVWLTSATGQKVEIQGFYYGPDEWRFRYAPDTLGPLRWEARLMARGTMVGQYAAWQGSVQVEHSTLEGFVSVGRGMNGPARLVLESGRSVPVIGINDCILDLDNSGTPHDDDWGFDGGNVFGDPSRVGPASEEALSTFGVMKTGRYTSLKNYAAAYGKAGAALSFFRWSVDNCSFRLWDRIEPGGNRYLEREGRWGDELVQEMRAQGIRIFMVIFGFFPPYASDPTEPQLQAIQEYVEYVVARYGASVDVWELMNEAYGDGKWTERVSAMLRTADPYHHPISTSWERVSNPSIDIVAPHWYETEDEERSDLRIVEQQDQFWSDKQPLIFGEQGNTSANWDPRSAVRMRLRVWTALFRQVGILFWNTSHTRQYKSNSANIYLGAEERRALRAGMDFMRQMPDNIELINQVFATNRSGEYGMQAMPSVIATPATGGFLRGYGIRGYHYLGLYFVQQQRIGNPAAVNLEIGLPVASVARWVDPATGVVVLEQHLPAGGVRTRSPAFTVDLAVTVSPEYGRFFYLPLSNLR